MPPHKILLPHLPPSLPIYITSYTSVTNSSHIHTQLLSSNQSYNYTFLDATSILSTTHLLSACFRALTDHLHNRLKSNNVHSEIVFGFSANNNIGDAFRRFGIGKGSGEVVVVWVGKGVGGEEEESVKSVERGLQGKVEGREVQWDEMDEWLGRVVDLDGVRKNYKLGKGQQGATSGGGGGGGKKGGKVNGVEEGNGQVIEDEVVKKDRERKEIERVVLGLMALRGAT